MNAHLLLPHEHSLKKDVRTCKAPKEPVVWESSPGDVHIVWTEASWHELNAGSSLDGFHSLRDCQPVVPVEVGGEDIGNLGEVVLGAGLNVEEMVDNLGLW